MNIIFGLATYRISVPETSWRVVGEQVRCTKCQDTLSFVFPCGSEGDKAGFAGAYLEPVGVRCRCFNAESGVKRSPVRIEAIP
jgi:hypothetical protein